jgi:hypothetical protein
VQNTTSSNSNSKSVNLSTSGFTPTGIGGSISKSSSDSKETLLTTITGNTVNIDTTQDTTIKGATIAAVDSEGNDNSQLNLKTDTLNVSSLNNTSKSKSISAGANIGGSFADNNLNNVGIDFSNDTTNSKTKTLATLGNGNIQITDQENSDTKMLNSDIANNTVDIYDIESHKGLQGELDTRLLTQDGRKDIKEDIERTIRTGEAIGDVASKESIEITDTFDHIGDVQKDLDVQKAFALAGDGKYVDVLQGESSTPEQKQEAINAYAQAYADVYGISIESAQVIAVDKYIKGATQNQTDTNNIYINDNAQNNALDYSQTMGHEVAHARVNQGQARDRESDALNEEYANVMGSYSADGMEFSSSNYNSVNLNQNTNTNTHLGNDNSVLIDQNNKKFTKTTLTKTDNVDFATGYSDYHDYETKKQEIDKFETLAQEQEAQGNIKEAKETREEIASLKNEVEAFEKEYGKDTQALVNISDEYNKLDEQQVQALAVLAGTEDIEAVFEGDPTAMAEMAANVLPFTRAGKYFVKVGDKVQEVTKVAYDKVADTIKRIEVKVDTNTLGMNGGNVKVGLKPKDNINNSSSIDDLSLLDDKSKKHILDGDNTKSGGHRYGTGNPGKTEFPESWSDQKIKNIISDIATDPNVKWKLESNGYKVTTKSVEGIDVKVIFDPKKDRIVSSYPTNTPRNPK